MAETDTTSAAPISAADAESKMHEELVRELNNTCKVIPEKIFKDFTMVKRLGRGTFAVVYLIRNRETKKLDALKVINKQLVEKPEHLATEMEALKKAKHPYVIQLKEIMETEKNVFLIQEYAEGGELFDRLIEHGVLTELEASIFMKKLFVAINYLHTQCNLIHRDLKPENILLVKGENGEFDPKIIDFGIAKLFDPAETVRGFLGRKPSPKTFSIVGSNGYTAPEILEAKGYDHSVDMWSLGVVAYILISGHHPFGQASFEEQYQRVITGRVDFEGAWKNVSPQARNLIGRLLDKDTQKRPSANEALRHPWIQNPEKCIASIGKPSLLSLSSKLRLKS